MIKFKYKYPIGFIQNFKANFVLGRVISKASNVLNHLEVNHPVEFNEYQNLLSNNYISSLVFCHPKKLRAKATEIYDAYPLIADRFNPAWNFKDFNFDFSLLELNRNEPHIAERILNYKPNLIDELQEIVRNKRSILANHFIVLLNQANTARKITIILTRIQNVYMGRSIPIKHLKDSYPAWFSELEKIFDYPHLREHYGRTIISSSNLSVCPCCNAVEINIINGINATATPDIDHFFPKSKYPFFAVSLNNFVPACSYCNQKFKKCKDTFVGHLHPLIGGTKDYYVFRFLPQLDAPPLISLRGRNGFNKNISMFELEAVYDSNDNKKEYQRLDNMFEGLKGINSRASVSQDKEKMAVFFKIGNGYNVWNTPKHKFLLDAVCDLSGGKFKN